MRLLKNVIILITALTSLFFAGTGVAAIEFWFSKTVVCPTKSEITMKQDPLSVNSVYVATKRGIKFSGYGAFSINPFASSQINVDDNGLQVIQCNYEGGLFLITAPKFKKCYYKYSFTEIPTCQSKSVRKCELKCQYHYKFF